MSWLCLLRNVKPAQILEKIQHLTRTPVLVLDGVEVFTIALRSSRWAAVLVLELPRRRRETRNSSQVRDIPACECDGFGLTYDMDGQHVFVLFPKPFNHTNHGRLRNNTPKRSKKCQDLMRYCTGTN